MITMKKYFKVQNIGLIDLTASDFFTDSVFLIDGADQYSGGSDRHNTYVKNVNIQNFWNGTGGNGFYFKCDAADEYIGGITLDNIQIERMKYGIRMNSGAASGSSWINGNIITNLKDYYSEFAIFCERDTGNASANLNGNLFTGMLQGNSAKSGKGITATRRGNIFWISLFDFDATDGIVMNSDSEDNLFIIRCGDDRISGTRDNNIIFNAEIQELEIANLKFGTHSALSGESVTGYITVEDKAGNTRKLAVVS